MGRSQVPGNRRTRTMKIAFILLLSLVSLASFASGNPEGGLQAGRKADATFLLEKQAEDVIRPVQETAHLKPWMKIGLGAGATVLALLTVYIGLKYLNLI